MTIKLADIIVYYRDENNERTHSLSTLANTDDDGKTLTFGLGYLPGIADALPEDIIVTVAQPMVNVPVGSVVLVVDELAETQTLTVTPA
ncbi:MAG TPA: hypothetical protein VK974_04750 [Methylophilaceae bacterium]|nr:hypothetical protein [Methylophilaceae bacterium]